MQSIASILEDEANFVAIFNEATHGGHQFGGYPNEQYYLYMKYGSEFMANKWGCETLLKHDGKLGNEKVERNVNVWSRMNAIAEKVWRLVHGLPRRRAETNTVDEYPTWAEIGSAVEKGMNR